MWVINNVSYAEVFVNFLMCLLSPYYVYQPMLFLHEYLYMILGRQIIWAVIILTYYLLRLLNITLRV